MSSLFNRCKIEQMGKCACGIKVLLKLETPLHEDEKSNTLGARSQTVLFAEIIRELREDHAEADKNLFK